MYFYFIKLQSNTNYRECSKLITLRLLLKKSQHLLALAAAYSGVLSPENILQQSSACITWALMVLATLQPALHWPSWFLQHFSLHYMAPHGSCNTTACITWALKVLAILQPALHGPSVRVLIATLQPALHGPSGFL